MHTCISSHGLKRSWRSCPRRVNAGNKNTPSTHHPQRRNVTTLMVGLKKRSHTQKSHPKVVNPRDIAGERKKNNQKTPKIFFPKTCHLLLWLDCRLLPTPPFCCVWHWARLSVSALQRLLHYWRRLDLPGLVAWRERVNDDLCCVVMSHSHPHSLGACPVLSGLAAATRTRTFSKAKFPN